MYMPTQPYKITVSDLEKVKPIVVIHHMGDGLLSVLMSETKLKNDDICREYISKTFSEIIDHEFLTYDDVTEIYEQNKQWFDTAMVNRPMFILKVDSHMTWLLPDFIQNYNDFHKTTIIYFNKQKTSGAIKQ